MDSHWKLRFCLVGLGRIGNLHLNNLLELSDRLVVAGICDTRAEVLEKEKSRAGIVAYADFSAMLEHEKPEALVIATPAANHPDLIAEAAFRGIHVFCEKPLALSRQEANRAARAVADAGIFFQLGFQRRFDRDYRAAQERIRAGVIGQPITFKAVARDAWEPNLHFARADVSGGLLLDMAIHDFDLARWLMGTEVRRVSTEGSSLLYPQLASVGDIDNAVVNLTFESGAIGNVEASRTGTYGYDIRTEIVGTRGALNVGQLGETNLLAANVERSRSDRPSSFEKRFLDSYKLEIKSFVECILGDRAPECGMRDALLSLEIALAATESLRKRAPVDLSLELTR